MQIEVNIETHRAFVVVLQRNLDKLREATKRFEDDEPSVPYVDKFLEFRELINTTVLERLNESMANSTIRVSNQTIDFNTLTERSQMLNVTPHLNQAIFQIYEAGGFMYEVDLRTLHDDRDWTDTIISGILGLVLIGVGIALLGPGAGVFQTAFATSLVAQGMGDIVAAIGAGITGNPIQMEQYLKSKAIAMVSSIISAGILSGLSEINALNDLLKLKETAEKFNKGFSVLKGAYLASQAVLSVGSYALGYHLQKQADKYIDKNSGNIKRQSQRLITQIIESHYESELRYVFAYDLMMRDDERAEMITNHAQSITKDYSKRFRSTEAQTARSATAQVIGGIAAGVLPGGNAAINAQIVSTAINSATDLGLGLIKFNEAEDDFRPEIQGKIREVGRSTPHTREMMRLDLLKDGNQITRSRAADIMSMLDTTPFVTAGDYGADIDYKNCAALNSLNLGDFASLLSVLLESCERVAGYMTGPRQAEKREAFKASLANILFSSLTGIIKSDIASPITSAISSIVAGKGSQLLYEHLTKEAAELRKTEQETKSSIEAEDLEPPRKHNKPKVKNPESASGQTHKVAAGDAIDKIAKNRGTTREKIIKDNPWLKDRIRTNARGQTIIDIFPGEHIIIPSPAASAPTQSAKDNKSPDQPKDPYAKAKRVINNLDGPSSFEKKLAHEQLDKVIKATENLSAEQLQELADELSRRQEAKSPLNRVLNAGQAHASSVVIDDTAKAAGAIEACFSNPACMMAVRILPIAAYIVVVLNTDNTLSDKFPWYKRMRDLESVPWDVCSQIFERSKADGDSKKQLRAPSVSSTNTPTPPDPCDWKPEEHGWTKNKEGKWHHPDAENIVGVHNKPNVQNTKLAEQLKELYRSDDKRPGGTAGELRREGEYGCNQGHLRKAEQRITNLKRIIEKEDLSRIDRKTAEKIISDLRDAVNKAKVSK